MKRRILIANRDINDDFNILTNLTLSQYKTVLVILSKIRHSWGALTIVTHHKPSLFITTPILAS